MRKNKNIIRPMLTHQTVARRRFTAEIKFKPNHYEYNRLNYFFIFHPEAYPSNLCLNKSKSFLSFDDPKKKNQRNRI